MWYYSGRKLPKSLLCLLVREHVLHHESLAAILDQGATFHPASLDLRQEDRGHGSFLRKGTVFVKLFKIPKKTERGGGYSTVRITSMLIRQLLT